MLSFLYIGGGKATGFGQNIRILTKPTTRGDMNSMFPAKLALLFVLVCATMSLDPVAANGPCTEQQKADIVLHCREYIKKKGPVTAPSYLDECCVAVRAVPGRDMECIIRLLSNKQKKKYDETKIRRFHHLCELENVPPPHRQVGLVLLTLKNY